MRREEKRRKFNEALHNMLHPPPPPSSLPKEEDVPLSIVPEDFEAYELRETGSKSPGGEDDDGEGESESPQKLTRAQRKRLRKKKLKEDASRRREIIGPLLPSTVDQGQNDTEGVRRNATEAPDAAAFVEKSGDKPPACSNQNKGRQRRKAKKLAREREQD